MLETTGQQRANPKIIRMIKSKIRLMDMLHAWKWWESRYSLKTEGTRMTGSPRQRWEDNVKINLNEMNGGLGSAHARHHARAHTHTHTHTKFVIKILICQVSHKVAYMRQTHSIQKWSNSSFWSLKSETKWNVAFLYLHYLQLFMTKNLLSKAKLYLPNLKKLIN